MRTETSLRGIFLKIFIVLILPFGGSFAHAATYLLLGTWSLRGPRMVIEALTLTWLVTFLNPGLYNLSNQSDLLRWMVICTAFISVTARTILQRSSLPRPFIWLMAFVCVSGLLSLAVSYAIDVSLFKLFSFGMAATAILLGFHLTRHEASYWQVWFLTFFGIIVLASFPLIILGVGYNTNGRGFQGLLNQPQAFGIFLGIFMAWLMGLIFEKRLPGRLLWLFAVVVSISLFATQSRTGMLAAVGGILLAVVIDVARRPGVKRHWWQWTFNFVPIIALVAVFALMNAENVTHATKKFILKGEIENAVGDGFQASRGRLIDASLANFIENPLTGIGFGVASDPGEFRIRRDPFLGLPVGASVEKGFAFFAVLEEIGLLGLPVFLGLVGSLIWPAFHSKAGIASSTLALGAIFVNFGESTFFALGGFGLLVWLLLGASSVLGNEVS